MHTGNARCRFLRRCLTNMFFFVVVIEVWHYQLHTDKHCNDCCQWSMSSCAFSVYWLSKGSFFSVYMLLLLRNWCTASIKNLSVKSWHWKLFTLHSCDIDSIQFLLISNSCKQLSSKALPVKTGVNIKKHLLSVIP